MADSNVMSPTKKAILPFASTFTRNAKIAYSFNNLKSGSLISIGQLCDDDCIAIFSKYNVKIKKKIKYLSKADKHPTDYGKYPLAQPPNYCQKNYPPMLPKMLQMELFNSIPPKVS